ncbi:MAG: DUF1343 domain-containing protein [Acidobacteria bacterium]|nr:DUF1343 domain-containing protein [Acidobacteriota bacterium]
MRHFRRQTLLAAPLLCLTAALPFRAHAQGRVVPGLEVLLTEQKSLIEGKRVGLITNHSGVDRRMRHAIDLIANTPGIRLAAIFAPEHGLRGAIEGGDEVADARDERSGVPVYSLYGKTQRPTAEMLRDIDVLVFDIQDAGVRFYTYISTLGECMEAAAARGIPFVVLDRPNPLAGVRVEGRMIDLVRFRSFVGAYPLPIRYGLTIGELAGFIKDGMKQDLMLTVVKMKNYRRRFWYDQTGLQWIAPSPNHPSLASATVYPGMCLFEGTNLSEGRGTTQPFEMIGAPWLDGVKLAQELAALKLEGVLFRPASFTPSFSKHQGVACHGIQVHVADRNRFQPVRVALHILSVIRRNYPEHFRWRESSMDRLAGSDDVRLAIDRNTPVDQILASWEDDLRKFDAARRRYFLYR